MRAKECFYLFSIVSNLLFFSVLSIFGQVYEGSDSSSIYKLYMSFVGGVVIAFTVMDVLRGRIHTTSSFWTLLVGLPLFVIASYYRQSGTYILNMSSLQQYLLYMLCFTYTACCTGIYIAHHGIEHFAKYLDVMMLIFTLSFFTAIVATIAGLANVGGAGYQTMSYMSGFAFCLNLCMILWGERYERFRLFVGEKWNTIAYFLLVVQLVACLISGGRGGFVLLAVGAAYMLYRSRKLGRLLTLCIFAVLVAIASFSFTETSLSDTLERSTYRTFDYLHGDSEHLKKVSGRTGVYAHALKIIQEDHYMGRGLFRSINEGYPHNFFLEVMEQGGVFYLLFWLFAIVVLIRRANFFIEQENAYILLPLMFYPLIQLNFSGTYITCPLFWFTISYTWTRSDLLS